MPKDIRIVIADDHPIFRQGLVMTISPDPSVSIIWEADNGQTALEIIEREQPDIAILDVDMPVLDGIDVARKMKESCGSTIPVFLTMHKDKSILRSLKKLGVRGYVLKDSAVTEILRCIKRVMAGKIYLSPALNELIVSGLDETADTEIPLLMERLTATEKNVLGLLSRSKTSREIADELTVSVRTIESHRYNICQKLNLKGSHALLVFATGNREKILETLTK